MDHPTLPRGPGVPVIHAVLCRLVGQTPLLQAPHNAGKYSIMSSRKPDAWHRVTLSTASWLALVDLYSSHAWVLTLW